MVLKVYKCEECDAEFAMDDQSVDDKECPYCPSCGDEDSVFPEGENEEE